jgi:hypothetical protein
MALIAVFCTLKPCGTRLNAIGRNSINSDCGVILYFNESLQAACNFWQVIERICVYMIC